MGFQIEDIKNTIICGDALKILKEFPAECIDVVITSPPYYYLRNYIGIDINKNYVKLAKKRIRGLTI